MLGRRRFLEMFISTPLAGCARPVAADAPAPPPRSVTGGDAAMGELRHLHARLARAPEDVAPTNGTERLEETEWPLLAFVFHADAATRLAAQLREGSSLRAASLAEARWALEESCRRGIPGAATSNGVAHLPDGHRFVALERFARVAQSDEHLLERRRLASAFERAFDASPTGILPSYASVWWTLDAAPALAGLALHGSDGRAARKWESTVRASALDPATGLVRAGFDPDRRRAIGPPRGCATMLALPDLADAAPAFAAEQWALAQTFLVRTLGELAVTGVREYPEPLELPPSVDSGRIIHGLGEAASGFALASAAAMNDHELLARFIRSARLVAPPEWEGDRLALRGVPPVGQAAMLRGKVWSAKTLLL